MNELKRLTNAAQFSLNGLKASLKEPAFRTEILILPFVILGAINLGSSKTEILLLIGSWVFVLIIEIINTAIEAVVDRIGSEYHELSGLAKDLGSFAVAISTALAIFTWLIILFYKDTYAIY